MFYSQEVGSTQWLQAVGGGVCDGNAAANSLKKKTRLKKTLGTEIQPVSISAVPRYWG